MAYFNWTPDLEIGVSSIDSQHQRLVVLINSLYEAMKAGKGQQVVESVLGELVDYTKKHFFAEEGYMRSRNYPGLAAHKEKHAAFTQEVEALVQAQSNGGIAVSIKTATFLRDWLKEHIMKTDKEFASL